MDDARSSPDLFVGKSCDFLLKKVDEAAFPLKSRQENEGRSVQPLGRESSHFSRLVKPLQTFVHLICELRMDKNAPCHLTLSQNRICAI